MKSSDQKSFSRLFTLFIVVTVTFLGYVSTYKIIAKSGAGFPCAKCDLRAVHPYEIQKLAPVCAACGDVFGDGYEHCCMCHDNFFDKCISALKK